jgi:hypothetical protein
MLERVLLELIRLLLVMAGHSSRPSTPYLLTNRKGVDARDKRRQARA